MTKKKTKLVSVRVDEATYELARKKAKERGWTISRLVQSFLHMVGHDETPKNWPPDIPEVTRRAQEQRPRRRKKSSTPTDGQEDA